MMNPRRVHLLPALCALLALAACSKPSPPPATDTRAADEAAIRHVLDEIGKRFDAGDYDGMLALYRDDVIVSGPGVPEVVGKQAWRQGLETTLPKGIKLKLRFDTQELEVAGDLAYERGNYAVELVDPATNAVKPLLGGRHIHMFKREADGSWKGWRLMENSPDPATAPKIPTQ
jgi:ketosteroid isomerase-like protein